jgi:3',5'-cyclic AMP phosphodiesterase CpdA
MGLISLVQFFPPAKIRKVASICLVLAVCLCAVFKRAAWKQGIGLETRLENNPAPGGAKELPMHCSSTCRRVIVAVCMMVCIAGCQLSPQSISARYEIMPQKPDGFAVSKRVLLVADNQLNHLYGDPFWLRNELFDKVVNVTIRPVQQDLFGQDILKWILQYYGRFIPVVHLGDGTNLACEGEFNQFREIMDSAGGPWVMAPGNHDAYLLGNLHTEKEDWWRQACARAQGPMTKDRFVRAYLGHLKSQHPDFGSYLDDHPDHGQWRSTGGSDIFLRAVAWNIDAQKPFRSFVLQQLDLRRSDSNLSFAALILDSSQYGNAPTLVPQPMISYNAGITGSMLADQADIAEQWLKDSAREKTMTVLMVHHPYGDLSVQARRIIDRLRRHYQIPLYISGHTHHGEYFVRGGDRGWLELNVGSTVDWPIEFRTFEIHGIMEDTDNLIFRSPLFRIPETWERAVGLRKPQCDTAWEVKETEAEDFYLAHNYKYSLSSEKSFKDIQVALLNTYKRMLGKVPSAADNTIWLPQCHSDQDVIKVIDRTISTDRLLAMSDLLIALAGFEKDRKPNDPRMQRDYRLCQAVWASKYDKLEGRKPVVSDLYIRFPKGGE